MHPTTLPWDYLLLTAANDAQAAAYQNQLDLRRNLDLLPNVHHAIAVADPGGRRIGSGASTVYSIQQVLERELVEAVEGHDNSDVWYDILKRLRILIIHAGGDSRRLPAYSAFGKAFTPVPGTTESVLWSTLFDLQITTYLDLPVMPGEGGQIVIASGDVLLSFDTSEVRWIAPGITGLGGAASADEASRHGVYCLDSQGVVCHYLQKSPVEELTAYGAVSSAGTSILDIGVMSFDTETAVHLLETFGTGITVQGTLTWQGDLGQAIDEHSLDFYREICCALGAETDCDRYIHTVQKSGSTWPVLLLKKLFRALREIQLSMQIVGTYEFHHFGTTQQLISSGGRVDIFQTETSDLQSPDAILINTRISGKGKIVCADSWIEGCRIEELLELEGQNVVVGVDVSAPLQLARKACLDVIGGHDRQGNDVWFVRCYNVDDQFKQTTEVGETFCGIPFQEWISSFGINELDLWPPEIPLEERSTWNARLFQAFPEPQGYRQLLWLFTPYTASEMERAAWLVADRYSLSEITELADLELFEVRRNHIHLEEVASKLPRLFHPGSGFSAAELSYMIANSEDPAFIVLSVLSGVLEQLSRSTSDGPPGGLAAARILHSLGTALLTIEDCSDILPHERLLKLIHSSDNLVAWMEAHDILPSKDTEVRSLATSLQSLAFRQLETTLITSLPPEQEPPVSTLINGETLWGRAPARLDLGGGWTDTPPYSLEQGGCVINAAVNLNGQPPIQCFTRIIEEPVIRLASIDQGTQIEISTLEDLLDYRVETSTFSLSKAALALSIFSRDAVTWPDSFSLRRMLSHFGGGIELTTLAAIPKGSGLGTSSIMGAVILATIKRLMGHNPAPRELFHNVLRLEQALTTGGGWQDQIGGVLGGVKVIESTPGLIPDPVIQQIPSDLLDPALNGGATLLYFTGITRLAKNILQQVVSRYLDRNSRTMATLCQLHRLPPLIADTLLKHDLPGFGGLIDTAWQLNKQLDPESTNEAIDSLMKRVADYVYGAKLLGAGGGGFLLMICRSASDAQTIQEMLESDPPNEHAQFFNFNVNHTGLEISVS